MAGVARRETEEIAYVSSLGCLTEFTASPIPNHTADDGVERTSVNFFQVGSRQRIMLAPAPDRPSSFRIHLIRNLTPDEQPGLRAFVTSVGDPGITRLHLIPEAQKGLTRATLGFRVSLPESGLADRLNIRLPLNPLSPGALPDNELMLAILERSLISTKGGVFPDARNAWRMLQTHEQTPPGVKAMLERLLLPGNWGIASTNAGDKTTSLLSYFV